MQPATGGGTAPPAKPAGSDASWSNIGSSQYRRDAQPPAAESVFGDAQSNAPSSHWTFQEAVEGCIDDDVEPQAAETMLADAQPQAAETMLAAAQPQAAYASATKKKNIFVCKQTNKKMKL